MRTGPFVHFPVPIVCGCAGSSSFLILGAIIGSLQTQSWLHFSQLGRKIRHFLMLWHLKLHLLSLFFCPTCELYPVATHFEVSDAAIGFHSYPPWQAAPHGTNIIVGLHIVGMSEGKPLFFCFDNSWQPPQVLSSPFSHFLHCLHCMHFPWKFLGMMWGALT